MKIQLAETAQRQMHELIMDAIAAIKNRPEETYINSFELIDSEYIIDYEPMVENYCEDEIIQPTLDILYHIKNNITITICSYEGDELHKFVNTYERAEKLKQLFPDFE